MESSYKSWIGGAQIGGIFGLNATWPFAKLTASEESIIVDIKFMRTYILDSTKVVSIEPCGIIPFFATGIRIKHNVPVYPKKIIFWTVAASAGPLLDDLRSLGYHCFK